MTSANFPKSAFFVGVVATLAISIVSSRMIIPSEKTSSVETSGKGTNAVWVAHYLNVTYSVAYRRCRIIYNNYYYLLHLDSRYNREYVDWWFGDRPHQMWNIWVDTKYNATTGNYTWGNGREILPSLWGPGEPSVRSEDTNIVIYWRGSYPSHLYLKVDTEPEVDKRFICLSEEFSED